MFIRMMASIVLTLLVSLTVLAQDATKPSDDQSKTKAVTGCLQKGDQADLFSAEIVEAQKRVRLAN